MSIKYTEIRRELQDNQYSLPSKKRSFKEIIRIFTKEFYIILSVLFFLLLASIILALLGYEFLSTIFILVDLILFAFIELKGEEIYNVEERKKELTSFEKSYLSYTTKIVETLYKFGITDKEKFNILKRECEQVVELQNNKFKALNKQTTEFLISIPLAALISSLIYKNSEALIEQLVSVMVIGVVIILMVKFLKKVLYYADGQFKDKQMLEMLKEVEYSFENQQSENKKAKTTDV